jgi:hypothetical protein
MTERPRLSDDLMHRIDAGLIEVYNYPKNVVDDTDPATRIKWLVDEVDKQADKDLSDF